VNSALLWQIALADGLVLCLAVGLGLWFRAWLRHEKEEMDRRLSALDAQQAHLDRISGRLQAVCRSLELMGRAGSWRVDSTTEGEAVRGKGDRNEGANSELEAREEDAYGRAWQMLADGAAPAEVARRLGMGIAEVELMHRMLRHRRQG
jgi:hypothetical protein